MKTALALAVTVALTAAAGCNKTNPNYCDEDTPCPGGAACDLVDHSCPQIDAGGPACTSSQDCPGSLPYCDVGGSGTCAVCGPEGPSACAASEPVCEDLACRPCSLDGECAGGVCLPDGSCPAPDAVIHATPDGTGVDCSAALPCALTQAMTNAIALPTTTRPVIQLAAGSYVVEATLDIPRDLTMIGPPLATPTSSPTAALRQNAADGPVVRVSGHDAAFYRLAAENAAIDGYGIRCENGGKVTLANVELHDNDVGHLYGENCELVVDQSAFLDGLGAGIIVDGGSLVVSRSRFTQVRDGGIDVSAAAFSITNSHFYQCGQDGTSVFGAIRIGDIPDGTPYTLEFNTLVDNHATTGFATGISCRSNLQEMMFASNLVLGDDPDIDVATGDGSLCSHDYSYLRNGNFGTGTHNLPAGTPPQLEVDNVHLSPTSVGRGAADPAATIAIDIDGDTRPMPAGAPRDIGADEVE